jgi:hypothetical protein
MTEKELKAWMLKLACFHEAGHAVVGLTLGIKQLKITLSEKQERKPNELYFVAQTGIYESLCSKADRATYGLAGWVAEELAQEPKTEIDHLILAVHDYMKRGMSATDRRDVKVVKGPALNAALEKSYHLLKEHWLAVEGLAHSLAYNPEGQLYVIPWHLDPTAPWRGHLKMTDNGPFPLLGN